MYAEIADHDGLTTMYLVSAASTNLLDCFLRDSSVSRAKFVAVAVEEEAKTNEAESAQSSVSTEVPDMVVD